MVFHQAYLTSPSPLFLNNEFINILIFGIFKFTTNIIFEYFDFTPFKNYFMATQTSFFSNEPRVFTVNYYDFF